MNVLPLQRFSCIRVSLAAIVKRDHERWGEVIRAAKITLD